MNSADDMLLGAPSDGRPSYAEIVERLVGTTSELFQAKATLREYGRLEDDPSLQHLVAAWRAKAQQETARAEQLGTRCSLAELCIRRLVAKHPCTAELQRWVDAGGQL